MSGTSINDILAKIDQRLDDLRLTDSSLPPVSLDPLSEVGLYITIDRLLADLYKQYLEAQRHYITCIETHGKEDVMTEIASDMADSSFCAMETRLIELREEKECADSVARVQEAQKQAYIEEMAQRQAVYAQRGIIQPQSATSVEYSNHNQKDLSFWVLFALSYLQQEGVSPVIQTPAACEFAKVAA